MNLPIVNGTLWLPSPREFGEALREHMRPIGWHCQVFEGGTGIGYIVRMQCPAVSDECDFDVPSSWFAFHDNHATILSRVCETTIGAIRNLTRWPKCAGGVSPTQEQPDEIARATRSKGAEPDWEKYTGVKRARP